MAARIVFQPRRQWVPSLCRGWRTPDPSPSRDWDEMPAPIMTIIEVETKQGDDDATQREKASTWDHTAMRTPSQSPEKSDSYGQDGVMTPRGHGPNINAWTPVHWQQAVSKKELHPKAREQTQPIPPSASGAQASPLLLLSELLRGGGEEQRRTNPVESKQGDDDATQREKASTWDYTTMRTLSQSPEKSDSYGQEEVMTPRGHGPNINAWTPVQWQQAIHEPECAPKASEQTQTIPPSAPGAQVSPLLLSEMLRGKLQCTNPVSMGEERFCESFMAATAAQAESNMQRSEQQGHPLPAYPWSDGHWPTPKRSDSKMKVETNNKNPKPLVSKGSVGHPYSCAEACKYAKKQRGCKDGASCDHCHLCDWKRYQSGRAACRAAAMSKWENQ